MELNTKFTSEELKGLIRQPEDSCPHLNEIILNFQKENSDFGKKTITDLNNALNIIEKIKIWQDSWKAEYLKNEKLSNNDSFVEAYIETVKHYKKNIIQIKHDKVIKELNKLITEYQDEINIKDNSNFSINENEKSKTYMNNHKMIILENVEKIREFASLNRKIGQSYKDAFKQISYENELNDIIQPIELIRDEQGNKDDVINLGIINHPKTFDNLIKHNYFEDHETASFKLFNDEKIENMIIKRIKEKHPNIKEIIYYNNIDDFKNKKGYNVQNLIRPDVKSNLKNKI